MEKEKHIKIGMDELSKIIENKKYNFICLERIKEKAERMVLDSSYPLSICDSLEKNLNQICLYFNEPSKFSKLVVVLNPPKNNVFASSSPLSYDVTNVTVCNNSLEIKFIYTGENFIAYNLSQYSIDYLEKKGDSFIKKDFVS